MNLPDLLLGRWRWVAAVAGVLAGLGTVLIPPLTRDSGCGYNQAHVLTIATGNDVSLNNQVRSLVRLWNTTYHPKGLPEARLEEISAQADTQHSQMIGALQSGGCRYDVLNLD